MQRRSNEEDVQRKKRGMKRIYMKRKVEEVAAEEKGNETKNI